MQYIESDASAGKKWLKNWLNIDSIICTNSESDCSSEGWRQQAAAMGGRLRPVGSRQQRWAAVSRGGLVTQCIYNVMTITS